MKVSFDFDSTLSRKCVQDYAQELIFRGFEVHIVTSRFEKAALNRSNSYNNADLFDVAERLGIPKEEFILQMVPTNLDFLKKILIFYFIWMMIFLN